MTRLEDCRWLNPGELSPLYPFVQDRDLLEKSGLRFLYKQLDQPESMTLFIEKGVTAWRRNAWDSEMLGREVAIVPMFSAADFSAAVELGQALTSQLKQASIEYALARLPSGWFHEIQGLEVAGFRYVDGLLTFQVSTDVILANGDPDPRIRLAAAEDAEILSMLGSRAFIFDRFHNDPLIPKGIADDLHRTWVDNSVTGSAADFVVTADGDCGPCGFVTVKIGEAEGIRFGTIVLVAVAAELAGRGLAKAMSRAAMRHLRERGVRYCSVGTQIANIPAANLYLSLGFRLHSTSLSLRWVSS